VEKQNREKQGRILDRSCRGFSLCSWLFKPEALYLKVDATRAEGSVLQKSTNK
jgi:hypothetical protein